MRTYVSADLELRHLVALQAIAETGSFWGAAERLGCSQSALSQQISAVEKMLDVRLVERSRGRRTVSMTEAGARRLGSAAAMPGGQRMAGIGERAVSMFVRNSNEIASSAALLAMTRGVSDALLPQ